MGWQSECGTHEGYLVGLVFDDQGVFAGKAGYPTEQDDDGAGYRSGRMRELGGGADDEHTVPLRFLKVACDCGWRSPLVRAPVGTEWYPSSVLADEKFRDRCGDLWQQHVNESGRANDGGYLLAELLGARRDAARRAR
jgi:hypothetical protein